MSPIPHEPLRDDEGGAVSVEETPAGRSTIPAADSDRRRYARVAASSSAVVATGPWYCRRRLAGTVTNLSETGLALQLPATPRIVPGAAVRIRLSIPAAFGAAAGTRCTVTGTVLWTQPAADGPQRCGIRLAKLLQEWLALTGWEWQRMGIACITLALFATIAVLKTYNVIWFWYNPEFQLYSVLVSCFIFSRTFLSLFYRSPKDCGFLPSTSLIIAVKNEEAHIAETVRRCFQSRYPAHLLEVLVIDDGSTDRTWEALQGLGPQYPALRIFRFADNRGKRHAMALGAEEARGEILVYVDSDSYLDPEGLYRLVQGFADPKVGAVAGHVEVVVEPTNPISKMESVRYFISHRIMKAAESVFGCVTCCSGAFSAYRRSAVMAVLAPWLNQTFLGTKATFGDDRSLTNFVLRRYRVIFCETARCQTYVPNTWSWYFRQQLRWKKSWSRETLVASRIMFHKHPIAAVSYYIGIVLTFLAPLMVIRNVLVLPLFYSMSCVPYLLGLLLVYLFFCGVYSYHTRSQYWPYGLAFAGLYIGVLCWQNYYAMVTVSRSHWGTR